jgi:hypothetical protein
VHYGFTGFTGFGGIFYVCSFTLILYVHSGVDDYVK